MALIALVPKYVGEDFNDAPPGHRYRLYLQFWNGDYSPTKKDKLAALRPLCKLPQHSQDVMKALAERSKAPDSETTLSIAADSTAPFATGLGWEHPNENGFAFLDPYGLPYLPGSGVKGVLRQAARDLIDDPSSETATWTPEAMTALFGEDDPNKPHGQGALRFWDVIPELAGGKLDVDILNPHYRDYYQEGGTPHDAGQPVPVFFLIVPPKSRFHFRVDLIAPFRLDENLRKDWKAMMQAAFMHAFDWLGFGAKTAVGYGAMKSLIVPPQKVAATMEEIWENATVKYDVSGRVMTATLGERKAIKSEAKALFEALGSKKRQEKAKSGELKTDVKVLMQDDKLELHEILSPAA
jgi:CRISPR-associated protein Cmr6